jgi:hypothetical protein
MFFYQGRMDGVCLADDGGEKYIAIPSRSSFPETTLLPAPQRANSSTSTVRSLLVCNQSIAK